MKTKLPAKFPDTVHVTKGDDETDLTAAISVEAVMKYAEAPCYVAEYKLVKVRKFRNEVTEVS